MAAHNAAARAAAELARQERSERVAELRRAGLSYTQIAHQLGISRRMAWQDMARVLAEAKERRANIGEECMALDLERLDRMAFGIYNKANGGDLQAIDRMLRIMERRARLVGYDAPAKVAPTNPEGDESYEGEAGTRWVYFLPQPAATEEEWLQQQATPDQDQASA